MKIEYLISNTDTRILIRGSCILNADIQNSAS